MKKAVPTIVSPKLRMRIGTSITIANASGRSSGSAPETFAALNAKNRQAMVIVLKRFARFMGFHQKNFLSQNINSPITGA